MPVKNGNYVCSGSLWGKNIHMFETIFAVKTSGLRAENTQKSSQSFNDTLAKNAIHLPNERMQLKVLIE